MASEPIPGGFALVVDDIEALAVATARVLARHCGLAVVPLTDGRAALSYCADRRPVIALLDVHMPTMDGLTLARRLRARHPGLPILFVTARPDAVDLARVARGSTAFLGVIAKPWSAEDLLAAVDATIGSLSLG